MTSSRTLRLTVALSLGLGLSLTAVATAGTPAPTWQAAKAAALAGFRPPPAATVASATRQPAGPGYHAVLLRLITHDGPGRATSCPVTAELFVPSSASARRPVPAILTTNGFGGSYQDQVPFAEFAARQGYATLTYSGLGFGGSGCQIELDLPEWDGEAASQLVSYLGTLSVIRHDGRDDPRVGMIGGSYGGDIQFVTASIDPRVDAIVPQITWNDLAYSLAPNNTAANFSYRDTVPGVEKFDWATLFFADGLAQEASYPSLSSPTCPNFDPRICRDYATSAALGYTDASTIHLLRATSMVSFYRHLHLPVLLMQGESDTLFNLDEAVANYNELRSVHDPVKLVLQSWGHSGSTPAPGELSNTSFAHGYETRLIFAWFAKWLDRQPVSTGPAVEYYRDWVRYPSSGSAQPAYASANSWPVGRYRALYLSMNGTLTTAPSRIVPGSVSFANPAGGEPASYSETSAVQDQSPFTELPPTDPPGSYVAFRTAPLAANVDCVGIPVLHLTLSATVPAGLSPILDPVVFAKVYDVAPDGSVVLVRRVVSPARLDRTGAVTLTLPGVVHRYPAGHRIELVLAATDAAYVNSRIADRLTVRSSPGSPAVMYLPTTG